MNIDSVQILKKRINEVDATCCGDIDANMALCRLLGFITGYVHGHLTITEQNQQYVLNRVHQILTESKKTR